MRVNLKRQFNYTARTKLSKSDVKLRLWSVDGAPPRVVVDDFGLNSANSPHDADRWLAARVVLEANRHSTSSFHRSEIGSVQDVSSRQGSQFSGTLEEFDSAENVVFTVKVVSRDSGVLLAEARNIRPEDVRIETNELLKVQEHDLGQEPWRLVWEDGVGPIVQVNRRLRDRDNFLTRDAFMEGAALPTVFRMILLRLLRDPEQRDTIAGAQWLRFAEEFAATQAPGSDDAEDPTDWNDADRWVNDVVSRFSTRHSHTDRINDLVSAPMED